MDELVINCQELSDADIIAKSLNDTEYFRCVIERFEKKMHRYISRHLYFSKELIEDIIQEAYIRIYKNLNAYDRTLSLENWIYRITYSTIIDQYRKTKRHNQGRIFKNEDDEDLFAKFAANTDLELELQQKIANVQIIQAIESLKLNLKEIAILRFVESKNYEEISDIVQQPLGTVSSNVKRAKEKIIEILKKRGDYEG